MNITSASAIKESHASSAQLTAAAASVRLQVRRAAAASGGFQNSVYRDACRAFSQNGPPDVCCADAAPGLCGAEPGLLRGGQLHRQTGLRPQTSEYLDTKNLHYEMCPPLSEEVNPVNDLSI